MTKIHDTPSNVAAEDGQVHVDGPDGVAVSLTVEAAEETAERLHDGAMHAAGQKRMKRWKDEEEESTRAK